MSNTLHSTKGLEFSRVYVGGAEDTELPGGSPAKGPTSHEVEEGRRLLYVGMTRTMDRLVLTRVAMRGGKRTCATQDSAWCASTFSTRERSQVARIPCSGSWTRAQLWSRMFALS